VTACLRCPNSPARFAGSRVRASFRAYVPENLRGLGFEHAAVAGVPRSISVWPSITTAIDGGGEAVSACADALESTFRRRIGMGVPSGSFVADGISDWLGEIPVERGWRSKGAFVIGEFEALPPKSLRADRRR